MRQHFHTVVVGGGCLGCASAISIQRRLRQTVGTSGARVCLVEKALVGSGVTARHSGIVRAANAVPSAAQLAKSAIEHWKDLRSVWGVSIEYDECGALWIAPDTGSGGNETWAALADSMSTLDIAFHAIDRRQAERVCTPGVTLHDGEVYFFEPEALVFDPAAVRHTQYEALRANSIDVLERTAIEGFESDDGGIRSVVTSNGTVTCDFVVNAAGAWSPSVFASLGIAIPVSVEPVHVANWLTSERDGIAGMPIIADYVNRAYFRLWRDGALHMHQPRRRGVRETARAFAGDPLSTTGAEFINDPSNQTLGYAPMRVYEGIARQRFGDIDTTTYSSGYRSFFDITPDLKFILGPDHRVGNLIHCLGAGQSFKYTPVFGEIVADCIAGAGAYLHGIDEFSIARFDKRYMQRFWSRASGVHHSPETEGLSL